MLRSMNLKNLNPHITCVLCGGYLVDATTITECLHSFCRSCIIEWLESSHQCPVCKIEVHKTRPILNIRPDRVLQDIIYKLVPGFYQDELQRRKSFKRKVIEGTENEEYGFNRKTSKEPWNSKYSIGKPVYIVLEYYGNWNSKPIFPRRYLRCSSQVTVKILKKFLLAKFGIPPSYETEIVRCDEILTENLTIEEIARIYGLHNKPYIDLQYAFISEVDNQHLPQQKLQQDKQLTPQQCPRIQDHQINRQHQPKQKPKTMKLKRKHKNTKPLPLKQTGLQKKRRKFHLTLKSEKDDKAKEMGALLPLTPDSDQQEPLPSVFLTSCP